MNQHDTLLSLALANINSSENAGAGMFNFHLDPPKEFIGGDHAELILQVYPVASICEDCNYGSIYILCYDSEGNHTDFAFDALPEPEKSCLIALFEKQVAGKPAVMPFTEITSAVLEENRALSEAILDGNRDIRQKARDAVAALLAALPGRQVLSEEALGFINYQTMGDDFIENALHALYLDGYGCIHVACDLGYDENDNPTVDWEDEDRELTFNECDHYSTINWPLTFSMLTGHLKRQL